MLRPLTGTDALDEDLTAEQRTPDCLTCLDDGEISEDVFCTCPVGRALAVYATGCQ